MAAIKLAIKPIPHGGLLAEVSPGSLGTRAVMEVGMPEREASQ